MDEKDLISTKSAADFLNVSHTYLIDLLEQGEITYTLVGVHGWVKFDELLVYKEKMINKSKAAMDELIQLSRELDLTNTYFSAAKTL